MAQVGNARLQVIQGFVGLSFDAHLVGLGLGTAQEPQLMLLQVHIGLQGVIALRHFGLFFQLFQVGVQLTQDVFDAGQVLAGVAQAVFGFAAAFFVFRDTRSFL